MIHNTLCVLFMETTQYSCMNPYTISVLYSYTIQLYDPKYLMCVIHGDYTIQLYESVYYMRAI